MPFISKTRYQCLLVSFGPSTSFGESSLGSSLGARGKSGENRISGEKMYPGAFFLYLPT